MQELLNGERRLIMIKVIASGWYCSLQDEGRFGYRNCGVPVSGAMDQAAFQLANKLLGNEMGAIALEITAKGPVLEFTEAAVVAISGADFSPKIDGRELGMNVVFAVSEGSTMTFDSPSEGIRAYLAIKGGFVTEPVLGSGSYYRGITAQWQLHKGDTLRFNKNSENEVELNSIEPSLKSVLDNEQIEVFEGPEFGLLSSPFQHKLLNTLCSVNSQSNRMAYLLDHTETLSAKQIVTAPVQPGTVQLTPGGRLIVLMRDAQTTGGYARIFQLTEDAINRMSQKRAGEEIKFKRVDLPFDTHV